MEKQKIEIPKLRATLDTLLADGAHRARHQANDGAPRLRGSHGAEARRRDCTEERGRGTSTGRRTGSFPRATKQTARTYFVLRDARDAAASRPGTRQLVHPADVLHSVQRNLAQQPEGTLAQGSLRSRAAKEEDQEADSEDRHIAELKSRSLFALGSQLVFDFTHVDLFGEEKL